MREKERVSRYGLAEAASLQNSCRGDSECSALHKSSSIPKGAVAQPFQFKKRNKGFVLRAAPFQNGGNGVGCCRYEEAADSERRRSACYLGFIIDPRLPGVRLGVVLKVACIGLLVLTAALAKPQRRLLVLALLFSAWGDLLLDVRHLSRLGPVQLFLLGLISFLIAQSFYIALFATNRHKGISTVRKVGCAIVVLVAVLTLRVLWPGLAEMRIPVLAYCVVLTTMAIMAQISGFSSKVAIGALFFVASDTMLALSIFGHPFAGSRVLVWVTYYVAQFMITVGVLGAARELSAGTVNSG
jgi:uncharacterized membrane protein YhhN